MTHDQFSMLLWNQVWQIALLWFFVVVVIKVTAINRPHLAHMLCVLVLLKFLIPPVCSSPISPFSWLTSAAQNLSITEFAKPIDAIQGQEKDWTISNSDWSFIDSPQSDEATEARHTGGGSPSWMIAIIRRGNLPSIVFLGWLASVSVISVWLWGRYFCFLAWIHSQANCDSERVTRIVSGLANELNLNRKIRTRVLEEPVGPAVIGLWLPTILLPKLIVDRLDDAQLRSLIAHEMVHIRRGDLVWSLLQMLVTCLWWFHPVAWFVHRKLSIESERCCDEETIASLKCPASAYARCLLSVLEQKHQLHIAPALPGVRSMQVTASRLERIMKMEHGCHQHCPTWIWAVLATLGVVLIPGAQFGVGQQPTASAVPSPVGQPNTSTESSTKSAEDESPLISSTHTVDDLLERIVADGEATAADANRMLLYRLQVYKSPKINTTERKTYAQPVREPMLPRSIVSQPDGEFQLTDGKLNVNSTLTVKKAVEDRIAKYRAYGFKSVLLQFQLFDCPRDLEFDGAKWTEADGTETVELNDEQIAWIIEQAKVNTLVHRLLASSVIASIGQTEKICTTKSMAIDTPRLDNSKAVAIVDTGVWLNATPTLTPDRRVQLQMGTKIVSHNPTDRAPAATYTTEEKAQCVVRLGSTVAIRTKKSDLTSTGQEKTLITLVKCSEPSFNNSKKGEVSMTVPSPRIREYTLDDGDLLGVYVDGVLPAKADNASKNRDVSTTSTESAGFPIAVHPNGKISLPMVAPIPVRGFTLEKVKESIGRAYADAKILKPEQIRVTVSLLRERSR